MPFILNAPVQSDRTGDSVKAIRTLIADFRGSAPPTAAEIARARANIARSRPGDLETGGSLLGSIERNQALGRPDDYLATLPRRLEETSDTAVAAAPLPALGDLVWVIVGDGATVRPQLQALGIPIEERAATPAQPSASAR